MRLSKAIWIGIVIAVLIGFVGFRQYLNQAPPVDESAQIVNFAYSHSGSSTLEIYSYEVAKDEESGEMIVRYDLFCELFVGELSADAEFLQELSALTGSYNLSKWDGFNKRNPHVSDGTGFKLDVCFDNGTGISASGGNSFPEGYGDASRAIDDLFRGYLKKHGVDLAGGF